MRKFNLVAIFSFLAFISIFFINHAEVAAKEVYIVDSPALTIRDAPAADAKPIGYLQDGDKIAIFNTENGWGQSFFNNEVGWVATQYLYPMSFSNMAVHTKKERLKINGEGVRIRTGPGTDYSIYGIATSQQSFVSVSSNKEWEEISLGNGKTGWVHSDLTTKTEKEDPKSNLPLYGYTIMLDAGHGGSDPGAIALDNTYEKNLTLKTVQLTAELLKEKGATIIYTREEDVDVSLNERIEMSNQSFADAFISFHYNSSIADTNRGSQTYYYDRNKNKLLAELIQTQLAEQVPLMDSGIIEGDFRVLKNNQNPSALVELGFLSNQEDLSIIHQQSFQVSAASAITDGLVRYFELK